MGDGEGQMNLVWLLVEQLCGRSDQQTSQPDESRKGCLVPVGCVGQIFGFCNACNKMGSCERAIQLSTSPRHLKRGRNARGNVRKGKEVMSVQLLLRVIDTGVVEIAAEWRVYSLENSGVSACRVRAWRAGRYDYSDDDL